MCVLQKSTVSLLGFVDVKVEDLINATGWLTSSLHAGLSLLLMMLSVNGYCDKYVFSSLFKPAVNMKLI